MERKKRKENSLSGKGRKKCKDVKKSVQKTVLVWREKKVKKETVLSF